MRIHGIVLILLTIICHCSVKAQQFEKFDTPFIYNFTKQVYGAENQNWSICQDTSGNMYFGNSAGLLRFNGKSWGLFSLDNGGIVRSVAIDKENKVFIGSYEEFGYWETNDFGTLKYRSLSRLLSNYSFHDEEIWKIIILGNKVFFQAFTKIFVYDGKKIKIINPNGVISCFSEVNGRLFVHLINKGLFEIKGNSLELVDNNILSGFGDIRQILPYGPETILVASYEKGIFVYNIKLKSLIPWNRKYQKLLSEKKINRALKTADNNYVFGTILDGLFIFNSGGHFIQQVNQGNGLQNNTILSLYNDMDNQLWCGLDNGIDNVRINSAISFSRNTKTNIGAVYSAIIHNNLFYVGTNRGLFFSEIRVDPVTGISTFDFQLIDESQDQVWYLKEVDGELFCGHNKGTYKIHGRSLEKISDVSGGLSMVKISKEGRDYILQGTYTNLAVYTKKNNHWEFSHIVDRFQHPVRDIEIDHLNHVWAGHFLKGLYELQLDENFNKVTSSSYFNSDKSFKNNNRVQVVRFRNRVLFINNGKAFVYNDFKDSIVPYNLFGHGNFRVPLIEKLIPVDNNYCWVVSKQSLLYYYFTDTLTQLMAKYPLSMFRNELIEKYEFILPLDINKSVVCLNEGIALINNNIRNENGKVRNVVVNQVLSEGKNKFLLKTQQADNEVPVLNYNQNTITFQFSCPSYNPGIKFNIRLIGLDTAWGQINSNKIRYERLPYNGYTFEICAIDGAGNKSAIEKWQFNIRPPFYLSAWAYIAYILIFFGGIGFIRKYYRKRMENQKLNLIEEKEKALIKMRNESLRSEIQQKTEQLADTTFSIIKKNELLMQIKSLLMDSGKGHGPQGRQINNTIRLIEKNISHSDDWKIFENNFEQAHREFLGRLKEDFPDLSPNDLKLCAFLRMNLSSKKIGSLLGISTRSVENHRYRIRKKLKLEHDSNLTDFIMGY